MTHHDLIVPSNRANGKEFTINTSQPVMFTGITFKHGTGDWYNGINHSKIVTSIINVDTCQEYYRYEFDMGIFLNLCRIIKLSGTSIVIMIPQHLVVDLRSVKIKDSGAILHGRIIVSNIADYITDINILTHNIDTNICTIKKQMHIVNICNPHTTFNESIIKGFLIRSDTRPSKIIIKANYNIIVDYGVIFCNIYIEYFPECDAYYVPLNTMVKFNEHNLDGAINMAERIELYIDNYTNNNAWFVTYV